MLDNREYSLVIPVPVHTEGLITVDIALFRSIPRESDPLNGNMCYEFLKCMKHTLIKYVATYFLFWE